MKKILKIVLLPTFILLNSCVSHRQYMIGCVDAYRKGFRVGRAIGRDEAMDVNDLMNGKAFKEDPEVEARLERIENAVKKK